MPKAKIMASNKVTLDVPDVKKLAGRYKRAIERGHKETALSAEQAVLAIGRAEAAVAEARNLAVFLDEV